MQGGYEIFALFMRYVFVALGALMLLRAFRWLQKDARAYRKEIKSLPDAGLVGEMVDMQTGKSYPLPREGVLGAGRSCDIRIKDGLLASRHLSFLFVEGKGLLIRPLGRKNVLLDGEMVVGQGFALHGTRLEAGGLMLRVRLFAGLHVPRRVLYQEDDEIDELGEPTPFEEVQGLLIRDEMPPAEENAPVYPYMQEAADMHMSYGFGQQEQAADPLYSQEGMYAPEQLQETWPDAPYPPDMLMQGQLADDTPSDMEDEDAYSAPFEDPVRKRRSDKYRM